MGRDHRIRTQAIHADHLIIDYFLALCEPHTTAIEQQMNGSVVHAVMSVHWASLSARRAPHDLLGSQGLSEPQPSCVFKEEKHEPSQHMHR